MLASMTGYGRAETRGEGYGFVWEVKSVNGRYLDVKWRIPATLRALEADWEKQVRAIASRGRVEVGLELNVTAQEMLGVRFNEPQARGMIQELERLAEHYGEVFVPDFNRLLGVPSLWREAGGEPDPGLAKDLAAGLDKALKDWRDSRAVEGEAMARDLRERMGTLARLAEAIGERVPDVLAAKRTALAERVSQVLAEAGAEPNEDRLLQETVHLADKLDVSEELTRLAAHLERIEEVLDAGGEAGKRLDFLIQETFREINTCGNKAQDTAVSRLVVDFKAELEKCREQVQNIE